MKTGVYYFKSWSGYQVPFKPIEPIDETELEEFDTYYIADYNQGNLMSFEKIYKGEREWKDHYEYWEDSDKIKQRRMEKNDGTINTQEFDKAGKIIK